MTISIKKAELMHAEGIEEIHLNYFQEIGEKIGCVADYLKRSENLALVAIDEKGVVVGYILSATYGTRNWFEWFGVKVKRQGIAQKLLQAYLKEIEVLGVKESVLVTRNRFKEAIVFYIKSGYEIKGITQGADEDLMITLKRKI